MRAIMILAVLFVAACGADGPPERPSEASKPGVTVSGSVAVGVTGS